MDTALESLETDQKGFAVILESSSLNEYALGQLSLCAHGQEDKTDICAQIMKETDKIGIVNRCPILQILLERCFKLFCSSFGDFTCFFLLLLFFLWLVCKILGRKKHYLDSFLTEQLGVTWLLFRLRFYCLTFFKMTTPAFI